MSTISKKNRVGLAYDPYLASHAPADIEEMNHPEQSERIYSIYQALLNNQLVQQCQPILSRDITREELEQIHDTRYLNKLEINLLQKQPKFTKISDAEADLYGNHHTWRCAKRSAGLAVDLVQAVWTGQLNSGFAIIRPPGHHASAGKANGFCFFNNVVLASQSILEKTPDAKILIVDWDVHYHLGTEKLVKNNKQITVFSIHRYECGDFYPGSKTGRTGTFNHGRLINIGFNGTKGDDFYVDSFKYVLQRVIQSNKPDIILVSCGFDAALGDPLGQCQVTPKGYYQMTQFLQQHCSKVVLLLEGGYNLKAIADSSVACVSSLLNLTIDTA